MSVCVCGVVSAVSGVSGGISTFFPRLFYTGIINILHRNYVKKRLRAKNFKYFVYLVSLILLIIYIYIYYRYIIYNKSTNNIIYNKLTILNIMKTNKIYTFTEL